MLKLLLNTQMISVILVKILMNTIQIKNKKIFTVSCLVIWLLMIINKKLNPIVTELFIRDRKLNISLVFITQSHFKVLKDFRQNSTHYVIKKMPNKKQLQQIANNHSSDIDFEEFKKDL